jgi:hypothetical protein
MRDAVAATGLAFNELFDWDAANLGCLSALQRQHRRGLLLRKELLCEAAARSGNLKDLMALRENGFPWDANTCKFAVSYRHLDVLQWAHANGCPWNEFTCAFAAYGRQLEVL